MFLFWFYKTKGWNMANVAESLLIPSICLISDMLVKNMN